jgi:mannose-6-phosphate isomerase-like protein (cupin superfamily)
MAQGPGPARDPATPVYWSVAQMKETDAMLSARVSPQTHNAATRPIASMTVIYRNGPSQAEIHQKQAEVIFVRDGEGTIIAGGKMVNGKPERADEIRGDSIDGGTTYHVAAGDSLYIPVNSPHQFLVEQGKHIAITIVKMTK